MSTRVAARCQSILVRRVVRLARHVVSVGSSQLGFGFPTTLSRWSEWLATSGGISTAFDVRLCSQVRSTLSDVTSLSLDGPDLVFASFLTAFCSLAAHQLLMMRHLQRKTAHVCPMDQNLRCVHALRAQKDAGAASEPLGPLTRPTGPSGAPQRVVRGGETRVCQPSDRESKNRAFDAHVSWFDRVCLTAHVLQQEKEELSHDLLRGLPPLSRSKSTTVSAALRHGTSRSKLVRRWRSTHFSSYRSMDVN